MKPETKIDTTERKALSSPLRLACLRKGFSQILLRPDIEQLGVGEGTGLREFCGKDLLDKRK